MSLDNAQCLAKQLGDPQKHKVCLHHTGRSGSTLLAQVFHRTGQVQVLSMPDVYKGLQRTFANKPLQTKPKQQLALMMTRLLCKPVMTYDHCTMILLKLKSNELALLPLLQSCVGWMDHICIYLKGLDIMHSKTTKLPIIRWELVIRNRFLKKLFFNMNFFSDFGNLK